jgi:carboxylate-amine ligase
VGAEEPPFTVGIEEDYLLVELDSHDVDEPPPALLRECTERGAGQINPELLPARLNVSTRVCRTVAQARTDLAHLRAIVVETGRKHGHAPIAASTHPFARPNRHVRSHWERLGDFAREIRRPLRPMMMCGMRVHVGLDNDDLRIDLMNQFSYFLPHLLALSCSSPFWEGEQTGFMSFRLTMLSSQPRTGLPESFASYDDFRRQVDMLIRSGLMEDTTKIGWDLRPSSRHPTLETRILDCCTSLDDAICLSALVATLLRMLYRQRRANRSWRRYSNFLVAENRWRALRYSYDAKLLDLARGELVEFPLLLAELLELVKEDAEALDCVAEVHHARTILARGTSAHRQLRLFQEARSRGASEREALKAVTEFLVRETQAGLAPQR